MPDGVLLMPLYGPAPADRIGRAFINRSTEGGKTWGQPSTVAHDPEQRIDCHEPPLLLLPNGKLLILMRTTGADGHLLRLRSGRILCTYGHRRRPFGVRAVVSDDGETWRMDRELALRSDGLHADLGYPASVLVEGDRVLTVYYFHDDKGIRYIAGTIYGEDDL